MSTFIAAYVTTNGQEWERPLCVDITLNKCKERFCEWYKNVDHKNCSVRYAPVKIVECQE